MRVSQLAATLELGIPVKVNNKMYRLLDGQIKMAVSSDKQPMYMGCFNEGLMYFASQITDEAQILNLTYQRVQVKKQGKPASFPEEIKHFIELGCDINESDTLDF